MKINKKSWHYAIWRSTYYIDIDDYPPNSTNLCQYVRRILMLPIWYLLKFYVWLMLVCIDGITYIINAVNGTSTRNSFIKQWTSAKKQKACPLIEFTDKP